MESSDLLKVWEKKEGLLGFGLRDRVLV